MLRIEVLIFAHQHTPDLVHAEDQLDEYLPCRPVGVAGERVDANVDEMLVFVGGEESVDVSQGLGLLEIVLDGLGGGLVLGGRDVDFVAGAFGGGVVVAGNVGEEVGLGLARCRSWNLSVKSLCRVHGQKTR